VTATGIVSGLGPPDAPGATAGMSRENRLLLRAGRLPLLPGALMAVVAAVARRRPELVLERASVAAVDRAAWQQLREVFRASLAEAFRGGGRGPAWELRLSARPWGFRLHDIRAPVRLWHGELDPNASVAMARQLAAAIPGCRATFYPWEGHLHFAHRLPEILAALGPS
jgi:pimeloyl-ACP methyl ester carboxylesterase